MKESVKRRINLHMLCQPTRDQFYSADRQWAQGQAKNCIAVEMEEVDQRSIIVSVERFNLGPDVSFLSPLAHCKMRDVDSRAWR